MAQEPKSDQALLTAFLEDADQTAFPEIVERHGPMVYRVCFRILTDHHESEDAAQATFAILARKAGSISKRRSLGSWLHGVARMTALYALRGRIHRRKREEEVALNHTDVESAPTESHESGALELLDEALDRLSPRQREAIVLRHLQGRSIAEAAVLAGCPPEVLTSRTRDGLDSLRKFFAKRGLAVSGLVLASLFEAEAGAAVPQTLLPSILAASQSVAAGAATGAAVSGSVLSLTEGVAKMIMLKQVIGLVVIPVMVASVAVTGTVIAQSKAQPAVTQSEPLTESKASAPSANSTRPATAMSFLPWELPLLAEELKKLDPRESAALGKADKAFAQGAYRDATALYDSFMREFPKSEATAYALVRKGRSLQLDNKRVEALKVYAEVLDYFPDGYYLCAAYYYTGECHYQNGATNEALEAWNEGLPLADQCVSVADYAQQAYLIKAQLLRAIGKLEEAIVAYQSADMPPKTLYAIAECLVGLERVDAAVEQLREIEVFFKNESPKAALTIAHVYNGAGKKELCVAEWRALIKKYPSTTESLVAHQELEKLGENSGGGGRKMP